MDISEHPFQVFRLLLQECADVSAWRGPRSSERDYVLDLRQRQAEPTSLADEREQPQHVGWIAPVAGRLALRGRKNAARLVQPERLSTDPAAPRDLPDEQTISRHNGRVILAVRVKVKRQTNAPAYPTRLTCCI